MSDRIRTIKPTIRRDQALARCSDSAKWLFVCLITLADDHGNFEADFDILHAEAFKLGPRRDIEALCQELSRLVTWYEVDGQRYGHLNGWGRHQRVDTAGRPEVPVPPGWVVQAVEKREGNRVRTYWRVTHELSQNGHEPVDKWRGANSHHQAAPLPTTSDLAPLDRKGREGKGKEGRGEGEEGAAPPPPEDTPALPSGQESEPSQTSTPDQPFDLAPPRRVLIERRDPESLNPRARKVLGRLVAARGTFPDLDDATLAGLAHDVEALAREHSQLDGQPISPLVDEAIGYAQTKAHPLTSDEQLALLLKRKFGYAVGEKLKDLHRERAKAPGGTTDADAILADAETAQRVLSAQAKARAANDAAAPRLAADSIAGALAKLKGPAFGTRPTIVRPSFSVDTTSPSDEDEAANG